MEGYEAQRLENLKEKQQLLEQLNLDSAIAVKKARAQASTKPPAKNRSLNTSLSSHPIRTSSRLASSQKPFYTTSSELDTSSSPNHTSKKSKPRSIKRTSSRSNTKTKTYSPSNTPNSTLPTQDISSIRLGWTSWRATAPPTHPRRQRFSPLPLPPNLHTQQVPLRDPPRRLPRRLLLATPSQPKARCHHPRRLARTPTPVDRRARRRTLPPQHSIRPHSEQIRGCVRPVDRRVGGCGLDKPHL